MSHIPKVAIFFRETKQTVHEQVGCLFQQLHAMNYRCVVHSVKTGNWFHQISERMKLNCQVHSSASGRPSCRDFRLPGGACVIIRRRKFLCCYSLLLWERHAIDIHRLQDSYHRGSDLNIALRYETLNVHCPLCPPIPGALEL